MPMLIKAEASSDLLNPGEYLWVTCWWQNTGEESAEEYLECFMDLEFGHQRIPETKNRYYRVKCSPSPGMHFWQYGDIWACTFRWNGQTDWSGTFKLYVGICSREGELLEFTGKDGKGVKRAYIGKIELGWGWGKPTVYLTRKPWEEAINKPFNIKTANKVNSKTVLLQDRISIEISEDVPAIKKISDGVSSFYFPGCKPEIVFRDREDGRKVFSFEKNISIDYKNNKIEKDSIKFTCDVSYNSRKSLSFSIRFTLNDRILAVRVEDIKDGNSLELLEVQFNSIISASGEDVYLVDFFGGGRLVSLKDTRPVVHEKNYDIRNAAALYNSSGLLLIESPHLDSKLYIGVRQNESCKEAFLGGSIVTGIAGNSPCVNTIKITPPPEFTIEFADLKGESPSWQAAAKLWRRGLKGKNRDLYRRTLFYKYLVTAGPKPLPGQVDEEDGYEIKRLEKTLSFHDVLKYIKEMNNILDGGHQTAYIAGFQKGGFDNSYPFMFETDSRAGTIDELRDCLVEGRKYNALVGLHDNYDDISLTEYFDRRIVALDEDGEPWHGWIWPSGLLCISGFKKYYLKGLLQERVKKTVELYGIEKSHHLDVLTSEPIRYDFDPEYPSGAEESYQYKLKLIEEFNKYGIDMTSEALIHPFVGHIGFGMWSRTDYKDELFPGDMYIPLVPMIYHGIIGYCGGGGTRKGMINGILSGAHTYWDIEERIETSHIDEIYIQNIPSGLLYDNIISDIRVNASQVFVDYGDNSHVSADLGKRSYEVVVKGSLIAKDFTTFAPGFKSGSYLAYSMEGGTISYPAPDGWYDGIKLRAVTLTLQGEGINIPCEVIDGIFGISIPKSTPVRVMPIFD
jgi:hypothetical protein